MATDRWMRASDQDRDSAAELLSEAYAVGRLTRAELEERAAAAYSAKTWGQLRELVADLPAPSAAAGTRSEIAAARRAPRKARPRPIGRTLWLLALALVLMAGMAGLVIPAALWAAAVLFPFALLLPPAIGISRHCADRGERRRSTPPPGGAESATPTMHNRPFRSYLYRETI
jgi:hypothetical protein